MVQLSLSLPLLFSGPTCRFPSELNLVVLVIPLRFVSILCAPLRLLLTSDLYLSVSPKTRLLSQAFERLPFFNTSRVHQSPASIDDLSTSTIKVVYRLLTVTRENGVSRGSEMWRS